MWGSNFEVQEDGWSDSEDEFHDAQRNISSPMPAKDDAESDNEERNPILWGEEDDSDIDADYSRIPGLQKSTDKRRAQNELFRAFASVQSNIITEKEVKDTLKNAKDDVLSIQAILAKQENSARISNPRDYQTELFQRAKEENIIAVLGTGSGKTHIATLLLRHVLDQEVEDRAKGIAPKTAFFLVSILLRIEI